MKSTGIVRKIDELGRVVIPKELRAALEIEDGETPMEVYTEGSAIILKKFETGCVFCDSADSLQDFKGRKVCNSCITRLSDTAQIPFSGK